jgi:glutaredoxin
MTELQHIEGKDHGQVIMYALSTCIWCRKTKKLLQELGISFSYVDMDLLDGKSKEKYTAELKNWNPNCSYPTLVLNNKECIVGYEENKIKEAFK